MTKPAFDTLRFAQRLEEAGFSARQAAGTAAAFGEAMVEILANVATKADLQHQVELLRRDMSAMELRLTVKLGGMIAAGVAVTAALVKLL